MSSLVRDIASRRELFIDYHLIDRLVGCRLQLQQPRLAGIAVTFNEPWEGRFSACITTLKDGALYRMYYRGLPNDNADGSTAECTCYAESHDGVNWIKPQFSRHAYAEHTRNNIIIYNQPPASHNFSPFIDTRPGVPESERLKAVAGLHESGIFVYSSGDGINWQKLSDSPVLKSTNGYAFDSQNVAFWSQQEGCYVFYFRTWHGFKKWGEAGYRWVSRSTSEDFLHWTDPVEMVVSDRAELQPEHIYTQGTHPYFRAPHIYVSLAARFMEKKQILSDQDAMMLGVAKGYYNDCSDTVLMTSRGKNRYDRCFMESFVRPGPGLNNWVSRTNYAGLGVVPTGSEEMSFYAHRDYAQLSCHAARYILRTDGFVSVNAPFAGGELVSHPLRFIGQKLLLNFATSAAGEIKVELQDDTGEPLPGYRLEESVPLVGDYIEREVRWVGGTSVSTLTGRPTRVRFVMQDADLFAMQFR
ncbi:MAG: hypothetical protein IT444_08815 [Phycisphaeraceae bacterium]|nr:hypothetical protein [Phycisphaeraceae bacterium]